MLTPSCFLCEQRPVFTKSEQYCDFNNKKICSICIEKLSTSVFPTSQKRIEIEAEIKENSTIQIGSWDKCSLHFHKKRLICQNCDTQICVLCVPLHNTHSFSSIEDIIVLLVPKLHELEYLSRHAYEESNQSNKELEETTNKLIRFFSKIQGKSSDVIYSKCKKTLQNIESGLKLQVPSYKDKNLSGLVNKLKFPEKVLETNKFLHWIQWNSPYLFVYNAEFAVTRHELKDYKIPHFSRSIATPKGIVICGGRLEVDSKGLHSAVLVKLDPVTVKPLPNMHFGKANQSLLYFDGDVYVIGGCDHDNKYSNRVEKYSFESNCWQVLASTNKTRDSATAVIRESEKAIYVFGGRFGGALITNSIEKYLIAANFWVSIDLQLTVPSMVLGSVKVNENQVLVFAGQNEVSQPLKFCNLVDLEKNQVFMMNEFQGGGCIVNEPILVGEKVACLVFVGANTRKLHFWNCERMVWDGEEQNG